MISRSRHACEGMAPRISRSYRCGRGLADGDGMEGVGLGIEDVHLAGDYEYRIAAGGGRVEQLIAGEFEVDPVPVVDGELKPDHAPERGDSLDARFPAGLAVAHAVDLEVVRADVDLGAGFRR